MAAPNTMEWWNQTAYGVMNFKYILYTLLAVIFTFLIHEAAHWLAGTQLGYPMVMTMNKAYPANGSYSETWHYTFISAVGPLTTLLQSLAVYLLLRRYQNNYVYPFLFCAFYVELLSGVMNFRNPNDLGRISTTLGFGLFTLPILIVLLHYLMVHDIYRRRKYGWKFGAGILFFTLLFSSAWILINQKFGIRIL